MAKSSAIHGSLCWYIDNNSANFCFRGFKCSMENGNWGNWYSKVHSREHTIISYIEKDINIEAYAHNNERNSKTFVSNILSGLFKHQTKILKKMARKDFLLPQHWMTLCYEQNLKCYCGPSIVTVKLWQTLCTILAHKYWEFYACIIYANYEDLMHI